MTKYHISADGEPRICAANVRSCPLGDEAEHYESLEAAYEGLEHRYGPEAFASLTRSGKDESKDSKPSSSKAPVRDVSTVTEDLVAIDGITTALGGMTQAEAAIEKEKSRVFNRDAFAHGELIKSNAIEGLDKSRLSVAERRADLLRQASHYDNFADFTALNSTVESEGEKEARAEAVANGLQSAYELRMRALPRANFFNRRRLARKRNELRLQKDARLKELSLRL